MDKLRIAKIKRGSMVDGPGGPRTVVWLQGCSIRCPGCQNWALWPKESSDTMIMDPTEAAELVLRIADGQPITVTGGEPFDQPMLGLFVHKLAHLGDTNPHIIIYTGSRFEDLVDAVYAQRGLDVANAFLALGAADVLVDGRYDSNLDNPHVQWRGSTNQRPIDLRQTRDNHVRANDGGWLDSLLEPVTLEAQWDTPTFEIVAGRIYGTGGLLNDMGLSDVAQEIPRCGQFEEGQDETEPTE